jgi:hypothetical protein
MDFYDALEEITERNAVFAVFVLGPNSRLLAPSEAAALLHRMGCSSVLVNLPGPDQPCLLGASTAMMDASQWQGLIDKLGELLSAHPVVLGEGRDALREALSEGNVPHGGVIHQMHDARRMGSIRTQAAYHTQVAFLGSSMQ